MKISTHHFALGLIASAIVSLTACGGGGGDSADGDNDDAPISTPIATPVVTAPATTPVTTTVMDGLIQNALVCVDSNANGLCETTELQGRTDASGKVTLNIPTVDVASAKLVAVVGLDAVDADTGLVTTAYTLQTPAGKTDVISPLTNMVQSKIVQDKASTGAVTSIESAEAYVKGQMGLTVSVFDNFIAKRDTSAEYKKAGEMARLLVVSAQKSTTALNTSGTSTTSSTDATCSTSAREASESNRSETESRVSTSLVTRLSDIRKLADDLEKLSCASSSNSVKTCDSEIQSRALVVASCTPAVVTPVVTPPVVTTPVVTTPVVTPPVVTTPVVTTPVVTPPVVTTPVVTTPVVTTPVVTTPVVTPPVVSAAATGKSIYSASCAMCHGPNPAQNISSILKGVNSATTLNAISSNKGGMGFLSSTINAQAASDLAAYLATPGI